jgi:hypothetical protein
MRTVSTVTPARAAPVSGSIEADGLNGLLNNDNVGIVVVVAGLFVLLGGKIVNQTAY